MTFFFFDFVGQQKSLKLAPKAQLSPSPIRQQSLSTDDLLQRLLVHTIFKHGPYFSGISVWHATVFDSMSALGLLKVQGDLWCLQILNFSLSLTFGSAERVRGKTQKNNIVAENYTQNSGKNKTPKILKITGLGTRLRSFRKTNNIIRDMETRHFTMFKQVSTSNHM